MHEDGCGNRNECGLLGGLFGDDCSMIIIIIVILFLCCGCNK